MLKRICLIGGLLIAAGCVPAPDYQQTKVLPVNDVKIRMTKSGKAEVSRLAEEETPVGDDAVVEPAEGG